mmetsp:Transcript_39135/g.72950  ORF Transcript_39135/g.72950 Transcript_39135/m.72950 type:complete len:102 (+) Transcript_39135:565-870(+)
MAKVATSVFLVAVAVLTPLAGTSSLTARCDEKLLGTLCAGTKAAACKDADLVPTEPASAAAAAMAGRRQGFERPARCIVADRKRGRLRYHKLRELLHSPNA